MDKDPLVRTVDPKSMRLQLERRGLGRIQGHPLWQEAAERMRERLSYIRLEDGPVLQHGLADYGQSIDIAPASLQRIESMGLLGALADARGTLAYWARSLKPGGLLMFVTLGPDSFRSLALALGDTQQRVHVAGYPDMHHLGDALVGLGMTNPVMDAEWVDLTYSTAESALNDLRMLGGNPLVGRRQGQHPHPNRTGLWSCLGGTAEIRPSAGGLAPSSPQKCRREHIIRPTRSSGLSCMWGERHGDVVEIMGVAAELRLDPTPVVYRLFGGGRDVGGRLVGLGAVRRLDCPPLFVGRTVSARTGVLDLRTPCDRS